MTPLAPQQFRERNRRYGVRVPPQEVEAHLLMGFEILSEPEDPDPNVLMRWPELRAAS